MHIGEAYKQWGGHLFVVIAKDSTDNVVIVNCTRHEHNRDQTCVVDPGEHPDITKKSIVLYRDATILSPEAQAKFLQAASKCAAVSNALLIRIQEGTDSDYCPHKVEEFVKASCRAVKLQQDAGNIGQSH